MQAYCFRLYFLLVTVIIFGGMVHYYTDREADVPMFGYNQVSTDHIGTRHSMHRKRTSISARTEKRRSHATERSAFRVFSTLPMMVRRRPWKRMKCRRYYCLQARPAFRHPGYWAVREELNAAQKARGFFGPRRGAGGREQGPRMKRSSIQQLKLRTRCARYRKLGHWARECAEGNRGQRNDDRYDRRAGRPEDNSKGFIAAAGHTARTFVAVDPGEVLWDTGVFKGTRRGTATETVVLIACGIRLPGRLEPGETRIRKRVSEARRSQSVLICVPVGFAAGRSTATAGRG